MKRLTIPYKLADGEQIYAIVCENCAKFADCNGKTNCVAALIRRIGELEDEVERYEGRINEQSNVFA